VGLGLDLVEQALAVSGELSEVSDPQAVGQVVVQGEVLLGLPKFLDGPELIGQTLLAVHRAGRVVTRQGEDGPPVIAEARPGEAVPDRPQLPRQPLIDVGFKFPGCESRRVAGRRRRDVGGQALPSSQPLGHPRTLSSAFLNLVQIAEEVALELEAVLGRLEDAQPGDELRDRGHHGLLRRVLQDLAGIRPRE
jgi:hypothetical protein